MLEIFPLFSRICKKLHLWGKAVADSLTHKKSLWKTSSLQQAALHDTIWHLPPQRTLATKISNYTLGSEDLICIIPCYVLYCANLKNWKKTNRTNNKAKQNEEDGNKLSGEYGV